MMAIVNWLLDGMDRVERMERQLAAVDTLVTIVADLKYQVSCLQDRSNDRPDVLDDMDQVTVAREELADMQCVLLEELGLEDEAETAEELAQRAVREIRQLRSELNAMVIGKLADPVPMVRVTDALHIAGRQLCPGCNTKWRLALCLFCAHNFPSHTECDDCDGMFWIDGETIPTPFELRGEFK